MSTTNNNGDVCKMPAVDIFKSAFIAYAIPIAFYFITNTQFFENFIRNYIDIDSPQGGLIKTVVFSILCILASWLYIKYSCSKR
ncbi:hypothetical protein [Dasineura jujubifolia toursvirus 2a]|nr:hypothetical protein [Dasineura jujubifolia toursvirus 2a]